MTLFDECKEALSENFHLLSEDEKEQVLKEFYTYPFEYGSIDKDSKLVLNTGTSFISAKT